MAEKEFYVYALYEVLGGIRRLVYIGKGHFSGKYSRIARYRYLHMVKNGSLGRRATELRQLGGTLEPKIVKKFGHNESAANAYEDYAIKKCLLNPALKLLNDQTGGGSGRTFTLATRLRLSAAHKGVRLPASAKKKLHDFWVGKPKTASHCAAIKIAKIGVSVPAKTREKISVSLSGRKWPRRKTKISAVEHVKLCCSGQYVGAVVLNDAQRKALYAMRRALRL